MSVMRYKRSNLPPLTDKQKMEIETLSQMVDSDIDRSDLPEMTEKELENAVQGRFYRPVKKHVTLRIDADVLAWLKAQGKGYQTRINAILRDRMLHG
jgi:uncharacterized protein (DUF4415 family)